jgi:hypothetical protein
VARDGTAGDDVINRLRRAPLAVHAAVLAVGLAIVVPFMHLDSSFTSDEGAYAIQAHAIADGHWNYPYVLADRDRTGEHFPIANAFVARGRWYPYPQHPAYPLALSVAWRAPARSVALHVLPLAGVIGCAIAAWLLAGQLDRRACPVAFWVAASAPVLANGWLLWAHAPSAAVGGLTLAGVIAVARKWSLVTAALTGVGLVLGVLLRSEGVLFAAACGAAVLVLRAAHRRRAMVLVAALAPAVVGIVAKLAERTWVAHITGGEGAGEPTRAGANGFLASRIDGAWHELFQGRYSEGAGWLAPLALVLAIAAGVQLRGGASSRRRATGLLAVAAALVVVRIVTAPDDPVTGLLAAWPVAAVGLAALDLRAAGAETKGMLAVVAVFTLLVLASQYRVGGGLEWGGRFLSPITAPVAALVAVALLDRLLPALTVLAVASAVGALVVVGTLRRDHDEAIDDIARNARPTVVTTLSAVPRLAWRLDGRVDWVLARTEDVAAVAADVERTRPGVLVVAGRGQRLSLDAGFEPVARASLNSDLLDLWVAP